MHRPGPRVLVREEPREEAPTGGNLALHVREERLEQCLEPGAALRSVEPRLHDLALEMAIAASIVSSWSASFEPKWANSRSCSRRARPRGGRDAGKLEAMEGRVLAG